MAITIGVTAGEIYNKDDPAAPVSFGQTRPYTDAVISAGGIPLILPLTADGTALRAMYDMLDGLLFAGGNDVDPQLYQEEPYPQTVDVSTYRDNCEIQLLKWALADKKPVLAICRGMQLLNVVSGGSLYQDIAHDLPQADNHNTASSLKDAGHLSHELRIQKDSKLAKILGLNTIKTNTHHHQAVKMVAPALQATAWSTDGVIEAVESKDDSFVIAVQSHPESLVHNTQKDWLKLFTAHVQAATRK